MGFICGEAVKIAQVVRHYNKTSGISKVVANLSESLFTLGHEIHVFSNTWNNYGHTGIVFHKVPIIKLNFPFEVSTFNYFSHLLVKPNDFDVVNNHSDSTVFGIYTAHSCHGFRWKGIIKDKEKLQRKENNCTSLDRYLIRMEEGIFLKRKYKKIIAVSNYVKRQIIETYAVPVEDIAVVHNGMNLEDFKIDKITMRNRIRKKHVIAADDIVLFFAGYDFKLKGLDVIFDAIPFISNPNIKLVVVGRDRAGDHITRQFIDIARERGFRNKVLFVGPQSNIMDYFAASDIFVFPTKSDSCAMVELEAMASGLPQIISGPYINGAAELMQDGRECFILNNNDPRELAQKIDMLVSNDVLRKKMSEMALVTIKEYSLEKVSQRILEVYKKTL